jgi:hypothetical protein
MGSEFTADDNNPDGSIVMFHLNGGLILSLYPGNP